MPVFPHPLCPDCGQQHQDWCPDDGPVEGPKRIQMTRNKPWRKDNPHAVIVSRPSKWGNPFTIHGAIEAGYNEPARVAVKAFEDWLSGDPWACGYLDVYEARRQAILDSIKELRGKDLACWCPLDQPCHADVLLRVANSDQVPS